MGDSSESPKRDTMTMFAASIIIWMRLKREQGADLASDGRCHLWERVLLVRAEDPDSAIQKASEFGMRDAASNSVDLTDDDGKPAELVFMGVRKLREVEWPESATGESTDITEVSASEMEVANSDDLVKLARGSSVFVQYVD
jgi:hypothetical protein